MVLGELLGLVLVAASHAHAHCVTRESDAGREPLLDRDPLNATRLQSVIGRLALDLDRRGLLALVGRVQPGQVLVDLLDLERQRVVAFLVGRVQRLAGLGRLLEDGVHLRDLRGARVLEVDDLIGVTLLHRRVLSRGNHARGGRNAGGFE